MKKKFLNLLNQVSFNRFGRLRSGWRFLLFLFLMIFFWGFFSQTVNLILLNLQIGYSPTSLSAQIVESLIPLTLAILLGWLCGKFLEDLPFRALGCWFTKDWLKDLLLGLIFGAAAVSFAVLIAVIFGGLRFQINQTAGQSAILLSLAISFAVFLIGAAFEEAFFRGYMLQTFTRTNFAWFAILLTSIFFAAVHLGNQGATWISTANTLLAGIWFSFAYLKTRTLWLAFGLHFMWNWMQGAFFGIEVSGITSITTAPLLTEFDRGPIWLTGENYGIEGGIVSTIALVIFILLIWFLPIFKPTKEMLALTSAENPLKTEART